MKKLVVGEFLCCVQEMPLTKDRWPNIYFYDVRQDKQVKVDCKDCKLKSGSTKGHGLGKYFQIIAVKPGKLDYNLYKFLSEGKYDEYKALMKGSKKSPKVSKKKPSRCNTLKSGKKKSKKRCVRSKTCSWVKGKRGSTRSPSRKGYCRKS